MLVHGLTGPVFRTLLETPKGDEDWALALKKR